MRVAKGSARAAGVGALALAASALAIVPGGVDAQAPAGPRFGENYRLSSTDTPGRGRDVPGLTVDPANPNHIVEVDSDPVNLECDYHVSFDGGRTWSGGHLRARIGGESPPFPTPACSQNFDSGGYHHFNTGVVYGTGQNVYVTFSAKRGPFNRPESNIENGPGDDVMLARSTDGGRTFQPAIPAISSTASPQPFRIRPQLAVQRGGGTGGQDRLYLSAWECFIKTRANGQRGGCAGGGGDRRMFVARSDDGGATWTAPVLASAANVRSGADVANAASPDEQVREPAQPVIGPDGAVYIGYRNRDLTSGTTCPLNPTGNIQANCIVVARSTDLGQTWQQFSTGVPISGGSGHPRLAVDPATPNGVGTLYIAYQGPSGADQDISLQRSTNRGQTWSSPVKVNDDPPAAPAVNQTNAWPSVGPGGRVDVTWADRRHQYPGGGRLLDIYYARSSNGGATFSANRRLTDRTINTAVGRFGDYGSYTWYGPVSLPLPDGRVLSAWADSREGDFDDGFQDVFLSRLDPSAPVGVSRSATATPAGLSVMLSRLAYPGGPEAVGGDPVTRVVVVNEGDVAGALAGAVLARANWGPLLVSPPGGLPGIVKTDVKRMRPEGAFVIGDTSSLSPTVANEVREGTRGGDKNVSRVAASESVAIADRPAETARQIAELMRPLPGSSPEAVIADPSSAEAGAASSLAAALKLPILFVDQRASLPAPTESAISSLGIKRALIVGGPGAVNAGAEARLNTLLGAGNVRRLGGVNQYETSEAVLGEARTRGLPANVVYVADGSRPVDGALLGAAVSRLAGLMLLTPGANVTAAESRLSALGLDAAVDRLVGAVGTGGVDPSDPSPPPIGSTIYNLPYPLSPATTCPAASSPNAARGTAAANRITGTVRADRILSAGGNDIVDALAGNDCVDLGTGADRGQGGSGDDSMLGGRGNDRVSASSGNDRLRGGPGNDRLDAGQGNDRAFGDTGNDLIQGSFGNDVLHGVAGSDRVHGSRGRDRINGGAGDDRVTGGSSRDRISGDRGSDRLNGNSGNDRVNGNSGNDRISARDGKRDRINCGTGRDRVIVDRVDRVARNCERVRRPR